MEACPHLTWFPPLLPTFPIPLPHSAALVPRSSSGTRSRGSIRRLLLYMTALLLVTAIALAACSFVSPRRWWSGGEPRRRYVTIYRTPSQYV